MSWLNEPHDAAPSGRHPGFATGRHDAAEATAFGSSLIAMGFAAWVGHRRKSQRSPACSTMIDNRNSVPLARLAAPVGSVVTIGLFINAVVEFFIVAFVLLCVVKASNATTKDQHAALPA